MAAFHFEIVSPEKLVFSGEVEAVVVPWNGRRVHCPQGPRAFDLKLEARRCRDRGDAGQKTPPLRAWRLRRSRRLRVLPSSPIKRSTWQISTRPRSKQGSAASKKKSPAPRVTRRAGPRSKSASAAGVKGRAQNLSGGSSYCERRPRLLSTQGTKCECGAGFSVQLPQILRVQAASTVLFRNRFRCGLRKADGILKAPPGRCPR